MYGPIVLDHFHHPRHVGEVSAATGHARLENPVCGDVVEFWTRVVEDRLEEVGFRAFGCAAAIASASMLAESVRGLPLTEILALEAGDLVEALGGLPASKTHGAALALETLTAALGGVVGS